MINAPTRLRKGGGTRKIQPRVVSDGTARMYDTSVNKSEKRTPALTASQTGSLELYHFCNSQKCVPLVRQFWGFEFQSCNTTHSGNTCRFILRATGVSRCMLTVSARFLGRPYRSGNARRRAQGFLRQENYCGN